MKKYLIYSLFLLAGTIQGQVQSYTNISYSIGFGIGDLGEYVGQPSFRGVAAEYNVMMTNNVGIGISAGWNVFYKEEDFATYTYENKSISGKQFRYSNNVPLLFKATYFFTEKDKVQPLASLGIGTIYTKRDTELGLYKVTQDAWNFCLAPEIGVLYYLNPQNAFSVSIKYFNGFQSGNELDESQNYFSLNLGFTF